MASSTILSDETIRGFGRNGWVTFEDVEKELAAKLSDDDVGGVLVLASSLHPIESLYLSRCVGITGKGLEPLRGSKALEQLDLSLVGPNESPNLSPEPAISKKDVIPILDSILDADGCSLKHVQFPKKWREEQSQMLVRFLSKYNRVMNEKNIACCGRTYIPEEHQSRPCARQCQGTCERPWVKKSGDDFGMHSFTCFSCTESYCQDCTQEEMQETCELCEKKFCNDCNQTLECHMCKVRTVDPILWYPPVHL